MYEEGHIYHNEKLGYTLVYHPTHPKAMKSGVYEGYVYEHVLIAEEIIDRELLPTEVVHHLDCNRSNNSPDNLLVLTGPMHGKLHKWMDKHSIIPNPVHQARLERGCVRCEVCQKPIDHNLTFCSPQCFHSTQVNDLKPSAEQLVRDLIDNSMVAVGRKYGVSDNAVRKWCGGYGIPTKRDDLRKLREEHST